MIFLLRGQLASLAPDEQDVLFEKYRQKNRQVLFVDLICAERNIYLPAVFVFSLYSQIKIGRSNYKSFMQNGALEGFLYRQNEYTVLKRSILFGGAIGKILIKYN